MVWAKVDDCGLVLDEGRVVLGGVCGRVRKGFGKRWGCRNLVEV